MAARDTIGQGRPSLVFGVADEDRRHRQRPCGGEIFALRERIPRQKEKRNRGRREHQPIAAAAIGHVSRQYSGVSHSDPSAQA